MSGDAGANLGVRGSVGHGRFEYRSSISMGVWTIDSARLKVDGEWQSVVPCEGGTIGAVLTCEGPVCRANREALPHNVNDSFSWDPCEGGPFTYEADIDMEPCCDTVTIGGRPHAGWDQTVQGIGIGRTTVEIRTDNSVTSEGIRRLTATCVDRLPETPHIRCDDQTCTTPVTPLPHNLDEGTAWDPCEGQPFGFSGHIDFEACCDALIIDGVEYRGESVDITGAALGATMVYLRTDGSVDSNGISTLDVRCGEASEGRYIRCNGDECVTDSEWLPEFLSETVVWDPCDGGAFDYRGHVDTEACCDFVTIAGRRFSGDTEIRGAAHGPARVSLHTDSTIPSRGLRHLTATCD
jgi:hypothetical protein